MKFRIELPKKLAIVLICSVALAGVVAVTLADDLSLGLVRFSGAIDRVGTRVLSRPAHRDPGAAYPSVQAHLAARQSSARIAGQPAPMARQGGRDDVSWLLRILSYERLEKNPAGRALVYPIVAPEER